MKYSVIFALGCFLLALTCCHTSKPEIVQSTAKIVVDTLFLKDTTHLHSTERTYIREIVYRDTALGHDVKEKIIIRDKNNTLTNAQSKYSAQKLDSTTTKNAPVSKSSRNNVPRFITFVFLVSVIIVVVFFLLLLFQRRLKIN